MYEGPVFNYVLRMVGDRALAEDLTQEIFLRIYQGLPGFSLRCRFTTWLFQIAKNRVLDELRARDRKPQVIVTLDDAPPLEVVDVPPERVEIIDAVWRAVALLNPDLKMALLLRDVVGLSYTEIADSWRSRSHVQVADLQGARRGAARARARGHRGRGLAPAGRAAVTLEGRRNAAQAAFRQSLLSQTPNSSRAARASGRPRSRISCCVLATSYSTRWKDALRLSRSRSIHAARGSVSRGWPTEPGFRRRRSSER